MCIVFLPLVKPCSGIMCSDVHDFGRLTQEIKGRPVYVVSEIKGPLSKEVPDGLTKTNVGLSYNKKD